jgi:F-type H+-transporting ATPase subunit b
MVDHNVPVAAEANAPAAGGINATTEAHGGAAEHHAEPSAFGLTAPAWIALAMIAVFAILIWKRVPAMIGKALDKKIAGISEQLDEAAKLRAEAEALKAEYEARSAQAGAEAATMLERARAEADSIVSKAEADAAALVERRTRMAEDKIAAAERAALDEVRAKTAAAAAAAAETLIRDKLDDKADNAMIDATIAELGRR